MLCIVLVFSQFCAKFQNMQVEVEAKDAGSLKNLGILQQTRWWAEMKESQGYEPRAYRITMETEEDRQIQDDLLVIMRKAMSGSESAPAMAYIPYGPEIDPGDENSGQFLEKLSHELMHYLPGNCGLIRFDLQWESPWLHDDNRYNDQGEWLGLPSEQTREFRMNISTKDWNLFKAPTDSLPSSTLCLDLNLSEEELLAQMKPKTRYNIRLAGRRGVQVRTAGKADLETWYRLYRETAERNHFYHHGTDFFEGMLKANEQSHENTGSIMLIAEHDGEALAAMWLGLSGRQATYLYGASSTNKRNLMPAYALQWAAIKKAKMAGCTYYDMFGISPTANPAHPMYGLYRFKKGFGGKQILRRGCWDYPLDERIYQHLRSVEMHAMGYHR